MDATLPAPARELLEAERALLEGLQGLLVRLDGPAGLREQLGDVIRNLDELFLVVVVGEFNAGKSSVLNALFGEKLLEEGPIPTTARITLLRYGETPRHRKLEDHIDERLLPIDLLEHMVLVDTPGTNSIIRQHQVLTEDFIPRADLILFVTSYDRPLSESERQFLSFVRESWGKRLVFILNKADLARDNEEALRQVIDHIAEGCRELLDFEPRIFPVSAELAYAAKTAASESVRSTLWPKSRFQELESFIHSTLSGSERLAIKLHAPLDTAERISASLIALLERRREQADADVETLRAFEDHLREEEAEFTDGYRRYLAEVDNALLEMERRGVQFLEDNIRVGKLSLLRNRDQFREEFARQVVRNHEHQIEDRLGEAVDWFLKRMLGLWNWTLNHFAERASAVRPAESGGGFAYNRVEIFESMMRQARRRIETYNLNEEARRILNNARNAAALFLGTEAVAGLGVIVTLLIVAAGVDVTGGFLASGALAVLGLIFLPRQRRRAVAEFRERIDGLRSDMESTLSEQLDSEMENSKERLRELVAPFARFVEEEQQLLAEAGDELHARLADADALRRRVRDQFGSSSV